MIELLQYKSDLRKLRIEQQKLYNKYQQARDRAKKQGFDDGELSFIGQEEQEIDNWINFRQTQYYQSVCQSLELPMPDRDNNEYYYKFNFDDDYGDRHILTTAGFHVVRNAIREEKKARREVFGFWFAVITGLIGALIGLVSVIKG